jgi:hypothetical protein
MSQGRSPSAICIKQGELVSAAIAGETVLVAEGTIEA